MQGTYIALGAILLIGAGVYFISSGQKDQAGSYATETTPTETMPTETMESETVDDDAMSDDAPANAEADMDIVETAVANEDFNTLVTAVTAADLAEVLQGEGPFTVFAPVDAAFADLPEGTVEELLLPANQADLAGILTYHVVPGEVRAADLTDGMSAATVNGAEVTVGVSDAGVTVNNANVVMADIETSNGIIHVIDTVLLPPTE